MKKIFILSLLAVLTLSVNTTYSQTVYASIASGAWNSGTVWETYPDFATAIAATPGSGTASTSTTNPGGTHNVLIRSGHTITMGAANRGCKSIIIQSGGKLWAGETTQRRLQIGAGGTGFVYPLVDTVQVDGVLGAASDGIYLETGTATQNVKLFGSGSIDIQRIRTVGGSGASDATTPGVLNFDINANVNLWQPSNYALSAVYNPATTDNYTITIFPGKTVTIKDPSGSFHNNQNTTTYGRYTYSVKGLLDVSANTGSTSCILTAPAPAASIITLNVDGGNFKLGTGFKADTSMTAPVSAGILEMNVKNGGVVDATATSNFNVGKTTDGAGGTRDLVFNTDATSSVKRTVGTTEVNFPVGASGTNTPNDVYITNTGVSDAFTVLVKNTFDAPVPDATKTVNRQWTITEGVVGGSVATVRLSWVAADQPAGFSPSGSVFIMRYTGTLWQSIPATVTGSGTVNDPYVASATGFTAFSPFAVSNTSALPVTFANAKAFQQNNGVEVEWSTASENNVDRYSIEKSTDGRSFAEASFVAAKGNTASFNTYSWYDATPGAGSNYYRIRSIDKDGVARYTGVMKVLIGKGSAGIIISPNPIKGRLINLQIRNLDKGTYTLRLVNSVGQQVYTSQLNHDGGSASQVLDIPGLKKGVYNLQVLNGATRLNNTVLVD